MRIVLFLNNLLLIFALLQSTSASSVGAAGNSAVELRPAEAAPESGQLTVAMNSATETSITFRAENKGAITTSEPEGRRIPHLVLNRNGVPTPGFERTLAISLENLTLPTTGVYAHLTIETQHGDPDLGGGEANRIKVWDETRFIPYSQESGPLTSVDFRIVFPQTFQHLQRETRMPTDYYTYHIRILDASGSLLKEFREDYAFLMENQWRAPLPKVLESTMGAAPKELVIYYYDMIPFQTDLRDASTQISRDHVDRYIQTELLPAMVHAFIKQTNLWNLPWYAEWSNYRDDEDPKTLSVALMEYGTWFHGSPPSLGHAMISIRVDGSFGEYSSLTEGIMSVFHHELFHNQQRNISFHFGSNGNLSGKDEAWKMFSEGTAVLASSVGQPLVQFEHGAGLRSYLKRASAFIGSQGVFGGSLNKSYRDVPYHTSVYWRFLYEHCGGIQNGRENPTAGMKVIRNVLETLYKGEIVDINSSTDVVSALPRILDTALQATPSCPFQTYEESLVHFARAIYLLRLEDGRCPGYIERPICGFHDPNNLYTSPQAETYRVREGSTLINGSIPSSYGVDMVELALDPAQKGKSLRVVLRATSTPQDEFHVELRAIKIFDGEKSITRISAQTVSLGSAKSEKGQLVLEIPVLDYDTFNGVGLVITRMDPFEAAGSPGNYAVKVHIE